MACPPEGPAEEPAHELACGLVREYVGRKKLESTTGAFESDMVSDENLLLRTMILTDHLNSHVESIRSAAARTS